MSAAVKIIGGTVVVAGLVAGSFYAGKRQALSHTAHSFHAEPSAGTATAKALWTCSMHPQVIQETPGICPICHMELVPMKQSDHKGSDGLTIDPAIVQNMGVRTSAVTKGPLVRNVRVLGYLEEPEPLHRDINLRVNGWIEKLYADTDGMVVTKGMPLFDLYSPELTVAIDELISARKQKDADATARAIYDSSMRKLLQLGLEQSQVDQLAALDTAPRTVPILSTLDGHLTAKMVYEGAAVKAGDLVLRLASRHRMWIDAQVYEQQMPLISNGQPARITLVAQPGKVIEGKVLFVHPHVNPQTRTALARIEIPNDDLSLRQGMYATVDILADSYAEALVIPREAVIDTGQRKIAFVSLGEGKFQPRELELGSVGQEGTVQVLSGLSEGERVVTAGQFLLDSESRIREAMAKFASGSEPTTQPGTNVAHASKPEPAPQPKAIISVPHANELLEGYLSISATLGERETENAKPIDVKPLIDLSSMAATHAGAEAKPYLEKLATTLQAMAGKPLEEQRAAFIEVSNAMIELVRVSPPDQKVYRVRCPMAFHSSGADWLQTTEDVANPYYAQEMKACGTVEEAFEARK